jgi:hypothetical protein
LYELDPVDQRVDLDRTLLGRVPVQAQCPAPHTSAEPMGGDGGADKTPSLALSVLFRALGLLLLKKVLLLLRLSLGPPQCDQFADGAREAEVVA